VPSAGTKSNAKSKPETTEATPHKPVAVPHLRIGFLVHDVSRMRRTIFDQMVKPLGITRAQWWALANLSRHEEGVIQSELARTMDVGKVTIGGLVDRLEATGLVERLTDDQDRRLRRIYITEAGYEIIDKMAEVGRKLNEEIVAGIPVKDVFLAEEVMHQMKSNLKNLLAARADGADEADVADGPF
jgi:MarR family transcriptional regulator, transcriptional regulator for hemolysin